MYAREDDARAELSDLSDADLIRWVKLGNDEALATLLERHSTALYRFCYQLTGNREDAEDILQETMSRVLTRMESLQSGAAFRTWLFRIAKNLSIDTFRSRKRICPLPEDELTPTPLQVDGPHTHVEEGEERVTVTEALGSLAESHRKVLVLREVEGLSYTDIAQRMNVSQSAVETLLFRARRRLREEYSKRAPSLPALALLGGLRDLAIRLAAPASATPLAAKVVLTAAIVGGAVSAPRIMAVPALPGAIHPVPPLSAKVHTHQAARVPVVAAVARGTVRISVTNTHRAGTFRVASVSSLRVRHVRVPAVSSRPRTIRSIGGPRGHLLRHRYHRHHRSHHSGMHTLKAPVQSSFGTGAMVASGPESAPSQPTYAVAQPSRSGLQVDKTTAGAAPVASMSQAPSPGSANGVSGAQPVAGKGQPPSGVSRNQGPASGPSAPAAPTSNAPSAGSTVQITSPGTPAPSGGLVTITSPSSQPPSQSLQPVVPPGTTPPGFGRQP